MTLKNGLTIKQNKFVEEFIENEGNGTKAALATYDTDDYMTAASIAKENLKKPQIVLALEKAGITDDRLTMVMNEGLQANKVISANVVVTLSDDPTVKPMKANGRTTDFIEVEDHAVRHKYLETALKLKGHLRNKELDEGEVRDVTINVLNYNADNNTTV